MSAAESTTATTSSKIKERPCLKCGKPCITRCSQCRALDFCSKECQLALWKFHKAFCKAIAKPTLAAAAGNNKSPSAASTKRCCLIVDGLGPCGPGGGYMSGAKRELLQRGMDVAVVDATKGGNDFATQLASLLQSGKGASFVPTAILILGWGSGTVPEEWNENMIFRQALQDWCRDAGGHLLVQGERISLCGNWPSWFDKGWISGDYCRTIHKCFATTADGGAGGGGPDTPVTHWCGWYKDNYAASRPTYNVKACLVKNVNAHDILYGTTDDSVTLSPVPGFGGQPVGVGSAAIAYGQFGQGTVAFFGDVNYEEMTLEIMAILASGGP